MKKITSFTSHLTAEGTRLSPTYSIIDDITGVISVSNERFNLIVVDKEVQSHIDALYEFLSTKIPE